MKSVACSPVTPSLLSGHSSSLRLDFGAFLTCKPAVAGGANFPSLAPRIMPSTNHSITPHPGIDSLLTLLLLLRHMCLKSRLSQRLRSLRQIFRLQQSNLFLHHQHIPSFLQSFTHHRQQPPHGIARLRTDSQPILRPTDINFDILDFSISGLRADGCLRDRVVCAEDFHGFRIASGAGLGEDDLDGVVSRWGDCLRNRGDVHCKRACVFGRLWGWRRVRGGV